MLSTAPDPRVPSAFRLGIAWVMMWVALALHVTDEALTGFLSVYNPTVLALRAARVLADADIRISRMAYRSDSWHSVAGDTFAICFSQCVVDPPDLLLCALVAGVVNALGHTVATILATRSVQCSSSVRRRVSIPRPCC